MNNAVLSGTIATPPELRFTQQSNKEVCEFQLEFVNPSQTESLKSIKVVCFGKTAQIAAQFLQGSNCIITGSININTREVNGTKRKFSEFIATAIESIPGAIAVNHIVITGRTGNDPDLKYFESGKCKASVSLATRRGKDATDWFDLEIWGKTAEIAGNYVRKGGLIGVSGQLKFDSWTDRNSGEERTKLLVNVGQLELLGSKQESQKDSYGSDASDYVF